MSRPLFLRPFRRHCLRHVFLERDHYHSLMMMVRLFRRSRSARNHRGYVNLYFRKKNFMVVRRLR